MKHYFLLVLVVVIVSVLSCKEKIEIVFLDIIQNDVEQYMQKHKYIVVIYIDSTACTPCSLNHLTFWKKHREELDRNNTGILLVIQNSDEQAIVNTLKSIKVAFPFMIDKDRKFKAKNIKIFHLAQNNTFVMDKDKNVIFIGSPIANEKNWESFIKLVKH
jgi:peroxiredoxin